MRPEINWWEAFWTRHVLRVGVEVGQVFLAVFTGSSLRGGMKDRGHISANGLYGQEFFRFLLDGEAKRSQRSGHRYQLLLVYYTDANGAMVPMGPDLAHTVISAMSRNMRDTDYIGWYREGCVVGGVLTVLGQDADVDGCHRFRKGLSDIFQAELGFENSRNVQVRVVRQDAIQEADLI